MQDFSNFGGLNITPSKKYENLMSAANPRAKYSISPEALYSALLGFSAIKGKKESKLKKEINSLPIATNTVKKEKTNFYKDINSLVNSVKVNFSPIGVNYSLKNKKKEIPLDSIGVSEMNEEMKNEFASGNETYFKNMMISKVYSDVKEAEQMFMMRLLKNNIKKTASEDNDITIDDFSPAIILGPEYISENIEKKASIDFEDVKDVFFSLDRPLDGYSGIPKNASIKFTPIQFKSEQEKLMDKKFLSKHINIIFMPDRVIYALNNNVIGTLPTIKMNEEGYENFKNNNIRYFKSFFNDEIKKGLLMFNNKETKVASLEQEKQSKSEAFLVQDTHPLLLDYILRNEYGKEWFYKDIYVLTKLIEKDIIKSEEPINSVCFDTILSIKCIHESDSCIKNIHAFEKVTRGINGKSIDFFRRESDIDIFEIIFSLEVISKIRKIKSIYSELSNDIISYISSVLSQKDIYVFSPCNVLESDKKVLKTINTLLCRNNLSKYIEADINTEKSVKDILYINETSIKIIEDMRINKISTNDMSNIGDIYKIDKSLITPIKIQVRINLICDSFSLLQNDKYNNQKKSLDMGDSL